MANLSAQRLFAVASFIMSIGALGFHSIDGMIADDAGGSHWVNSFYCSAITLTTIGYGDICPSDKMPPIGRVFIVALSFCGLGMFCGPIMDYSASWQGRIPGGALGPGLFALGFGTILFMHIEDMAWQEAVYFTFITGTTVGYGDLSPSTDYGRLATAVFAILVVNVVGGMLEPAKKHLSDLCMVTAPSTTQNQIKLTKKQKKKRQKKKQN